MSFSFVGNASGAATNGASVTVTLPSVSPGDTVIVFSAVSRTGFAQTVASSTGATYNQILAPTGSTNSLIFLSAWGRIMPNPAEASITCSGTGNLQDVTLVAVMAYRDSLGQILSATQNTTTGNSTGPDSPAVTAGSTGTVIISAFATSVPDGIVTQPSSYLNVISTAASDTREGTIAAAWVIAGASGSFDPTAWSGVSSAPWIAATIGLDPVTFVWFPSMPFDRFDLRYKSEGY